VLLSGTMLLFNLGISPTFFMNGIQPNRVLGGAGVRSCGRKAPKYVRGAYCLGNRDRSRMKRAKYIPAMINVGTRVEIRPEREGEPSLAEPMF